MHPGKLITFEGIDGCGKTTQMKLTAAWLKEQGYEVLQTYQPGGTAIGRQIREVLLQRENRKLVAEAEMLLYLADRIQHLKEVILPAVGKGVIVLCDRFHDSTVAYQGYGRGLDMSLTGSIVRVCITPHPPDLTFLLVVPPRTALQRIDASPGKSRQRDRLEEESIQFFERVSRGYDELASSAPDRFVHIDGSISPESIQERIKSVLKKKLTQPAS